MRKRDHAGVTWRIMASSTGLVFSVEITIAGCRLAKTRNTSSAKPWPTDFTSRKSSTISLNFRDVNSVGQGFADEVFRVFASRHPAIVISTENTNPVLDAMIRHVTPA